jgi:3'-5' exonuclease
MALENIPLENILFIDIETVPQHPVYDNMPQQLQALWSKKAERMLEIGQSPADIYSKAGIFAEFGKIVCISAAYLRPAGNAYELRAAAYYGSDEAQVISGFSGLVSAYFSKEKHYMCAHNGKEFDFPYIARRSLLLGIDIPKGLDTRGLKPWEVKHLDTLDLWRFGDYKHYTSLPLLAAVFGIPTPKDDIDGSQVADVYWKENDIHRIANYCNKDVIAVAQLYLRYRGLPMIDEENIKIIEKEATAF